MTTDAVIRPVVEIASLSVGTHHHDGRTLLHSVDLAMQPGERVGLVGESGSGKSLLSLSIIGLLPEATSITGGSVTVGDSRVDLATEHELASLRGSRMAMIYQNPLGSLNPVMTIGKQIAEAILVHRPVSMRAARQQAVDLLGRVGIADAAANAERYPHEFSGGMRQRVMIAMAICCEPSLLLADEPTTALDVTTQARILELLDELSRERDMAVLFVTHNLAVASEFCDRIDVMRKGRIVESGPTDVVLRAPAHPYTRALRDSLCTLDTDPAKPLGAVSTEDLDEDSDSTPTIRRIA
jgi:peptide/nickel transport system ATP-binding protein